MLVSQGRSGLQEEGGQGQGGWGHLVCLEMCERVGSVQVCVTHPLLSSPALITEQNNAKQFSLLRSNLPSSY